jgi:hypothetical protein
VVASVIAPFIREFVHSDCPRSRVQWTSTAGHRSNCHIAPEPPSLQVVAAEQASPHLGGVVYRRKKR